MLKYFPSLPTMIGTFLALRSLDSLYIINDYTRYSLLFMYRVSKYYAQNKKSPRIGFINEKIHGKI